MVPEVLAPPLDELEGQFASLLAGRQIAVWPQFPVVQSYPKSANTDPTKLRAPVSSYTKVE